MLRENGTLANALSQGNFVPMVSRAWHLNHRVGEIILIALSPAHVLFYHYIIKAKKTLPSVQYAEKKLKKQQWATWCRHYLPHLVTTRTMKHWGQEWTIT